ncbi:hypothetical protein [Tabrizicola sp.]|uniref:hypothetical protein n=1 Tax=Tabrizicola sp. TaxID=2005166 RepID=UPI0035AE76C7
MTVSQWSVLLEGHPFDLADACDTFRQPGRVVIEVADDLRDGPHAVLISEAFSTAGDAVEVLRIAQHLLDRVNAVLFGLNPDRIPLRPSGWLAERRIDGTVGMQVVEHIHETLVVRDRVAATHVGPCAEQNDQRREACEVQWVNDSFSDDTFADVLSFFRGQPDWLELWKAFETMRADINRGAGRLPEARAFRWPAKPALSHFQMSAQVHRHSPQKWPDGMTSRDAMPLDEARRFIADLFIRWAEWRDELQSPRRPS